MEVQVWLLFVPQAPLVVVEMARLILHPRALEVLSFKAKVLFSFNDGTRQ